MNSKQRRKQRRIAARNEAFAAAIVSNSRVWQMAYGRMRQAWAEAVYSPYTLDFSAVPGPTLRAVLSDLPAPPPQLPPKWRGGGVSEEP